MAEIIVDIGDNLVETIGCEFKGELVRCKECKYEPICNHRVQHTTHTPTSVTIGSKAVDFCSYGERKSDE